MNPRLPSDHSQNKTKILRHCTESEKTDHSPAHLALSDGEAGKLCDEKAMATVAWN